MHALLAPIVALLALGASSQPPARGVLVEHVSCPNDPSADIYTLPTVHISNDTELAAAARVRSRRPGRSRGRSLSGGRGAVRMDHRGIGELTERSMGTNPARRQCDVAGVTWWLCRRRTSHLHRRALGRSNGRVVDRAADRPGCGRDRFRATQSGITVCQRKAVRLVWKRRTQRLQFSPGEEHRRAAGRVEIHASSRLFRWRPSVAAHRAHVPRAGVDGGRRDERGAPRPAISIWPARFSPTTSRARVDSKSGDC